ncbi:hypothetical protein CHELA40_14174 [Chelatococcus asaccharovorans]|nr:hypothetical protein CHELA17_61446 [Chelatococcus asaccharovorans]CAH1675688.1 hypothetical protein CHELA40_14174 [Chelatococcus asaccharovorans]
MTAKKAVITDPDTGEILPAMKMRGSKRGGAFAGQAAPSVWPGLTRARISTTCGSRRWRSDWLEFARPPSACAAAAGRLEHFRVSPNRENDPCFYFSAFSSREPVSTSLENALDDDEPEVRIAFGQIHAHNVHLVRSAVIMRQKTRIADRVFDRAQIPNAPMVRIRFNRLGTRQKIVWDQILDVFIQDGQPHLVLVCQPNLALIIFGSEPIFPRHCILIKIVPVAVLATMQLLLVAPLVNSIPRLRNPAKAILSYICHPTSPIYYKYTNIHIF